jgi:hypothetical protein
MGIAMIVEREEEKKEGGKKGK